MIITTCQEIRMRIFMILWLLVVHLSTFDSVAIAISLTTFGTPCADETITFTCTVSGVVLQWDPSDLPSGQSISITTQTSSSITRGLYTAVLDSSNATTVTSILTTTARDSVSIECVEVGTGMRELLSITLAIPPSPPVNVRHSVQSSTTDEAVVSVQWDPPDNNGGRDDLNYTVSISPSTTQLSATVVTSTTVTVTVDYNEDYTINIVATNCAGNSTAVEYMFRVAGCPPLSTPSNGGLEMYTDRSVEATVTFQCDPGFMSTGPLTATCMTDMTWSPDPGTFVCSLPTTQPPAQTTPPILCPPLQPPSNGRFVDYTPNTNSPVSTTVTFQCDDGLFPRDVMATTCGASGQWHRNPSDLVCRERPVNCSLPAEPRNGTILGYDNFNLTVIEGTMLTFQCDSGFLLNGEMTITCTNAGEWSTDPNGLECTVAMLVAPLSSGAAVGVSVVVTFIVAVFIGFLAGLLVMYLMMRKKATFNPSVVSTNPQPQEQPPPPGPVYEEVSTPKENIELETNLAYGPVRH